MNKKLYISVLFVVLCMAFAAVPAFAAFTLPTLPTTDLELAGTAVASLIGVYAVVRLAIRMIKGA
jgi:hypothetical protein